MTGRGPKKFNFIATVFIYGSILKFLNLIYEVMKVYVKLIYIDKEMVMNIST